MALDQLPDAPDPASDTPQAFSLKAAAMVLAQKQMVDQFNSEVASLNALFAGGAYSFMYAFDSATADADPGLGRLRLNTATQNAATVLRIDQQVAGGANIASLFDMIGAGTSVLKGAVRMVKASDPTQWMLFDILAVNAASGYRNFTVAHRGGTSASPFSNGESVMVYIDRAGDVGNGAEVLIPGGSVDITDPAALINFLNIFSSLYDNYRIELSGVTLSANVSIAVRLAVAGSAVSTGYTSANAEGGSATSSADTQWLAGITSISPRVATIEILNANGTNTPKQFRYSGVTQGVNSGTVYVTTIRAGMYVGSQAASGFQLLLTGAGNFTGGKIRVYGRRN